MNDIIAHGDNINILLARYGVKFGIYKNGVFHEQLFPFDPIPRVISAEDFSYLERGLKQRVDALNLFLSDVYGAKNIIKDGVVPEDFVYSSSGYLPECEGIMPPAGIYSHISGIDLVQAKDGTWYVLEDNLRIPSGASYPLIARSLERKASPGVFRTHTIRDNRNYASLLKETMDHVNLGGINVILTPGRYNAAFFEHSYLAEKTGSTLAMPNDLFIQDCKLYYRGDDGKKQRVGCVYRRQSDEFLDPCTFRSDSLIGVPNLMAAYRAGNVAIVNAPGNGVADDKGIYYFVPKMIEYYLHETPILHNAPTYLPMYEEDKKFVLEKRDCLYWLGRYTERVYTTLKVFYNYYDAMIDRNENAYITLCEQLDIPNIYTSEQDFIYRFLFDKNDPNSILTSLNRSYDNGIVLRNEISSDSLAYIQMALDIYTASSTSDVPTMALLPVQDYILAFWASIDDNVLDQRARSIIKCGRYLERLDLYLRLDFPEQTIERTLCKMIPRLKQSGMHYDQEVLDTIYARSRQKMLQTDGWKKQCARHLLTLITQQ